MGRRSPVAAASDDAQEVNAPIALELSPDLNGVLAPDVSPNRPVQVIYEHSLVQ